MSSRVLLVLSVVLLALAVVPARAQQPDAQPPTPPAPAAAAPDAPPAPSINPDALPVNLARIQRRLSKPPAIRPEGRPIFRVEVFGRNPTIDEILGPDWRKGPTPAGAMSHQEFLDLVTPSDVKGYAAFDNKQAMIVAATSFALKWALQQAVKKLDDAKTDRQKAAAQKEVDEALAALRKARRDAGLPDR